jgi:hypothetical protein
MKSDNISFNICKKKEGILDINEKIFPNHFLGCICGKPGSGKTSLLKFLLKCDNLLYKKFDFIFILSPSYLEYQDIFLPKENYIDDLDYEWINSKIKYINNKYKNYYINVLFIIDDMISSLYKNRYSKELLCFIFNRRHLLKKGMISIILTSQKYSLIPTSIRSNINLLFMFRLNNIDIYNIKKDIIFDINLFDKALYETFYNNNNNNNNNFLYIRLDNNTYFKNFDLLF